MVKGIFDITRDIEVEKAGGFWCLACLISHPASEQSPDHRYCQRCYEFLLDEVEILRESGRWKRPGWIPSKPQRGQGKQRNVPQTMPLIMSTVERAKIIGDIIQPSVATKPIIKRGRKPIELPRELIAELANKGMGSKAIAGQLKADLGIKVSYKTIQRILRDGY